MNGRGRGLSAEPLLVLAAFLFGGLQTAAFWLSSPNAVPAQVAVHALMAQVGAFFWIALLPALRALAAAFPFAEGRLRRAVLVHVAGAVTASLLQPTVIQAVPLLLGFRQMPWTVRVFGQLDLNLVCYACVVAVSSSLHAGRGLASARAEADRRQAALTAAELHVLNVQLQPHFLFNALNTLAELVHQDARAARALVSDLRGLLEASFRGDGPPEVDLGDELRLARRYLDVQKRRFGDRLTFSVEVDPSADGALVPRLLLQPLVENAVRHGVSSRGAGSVTVTAARGRDGLRVAVRDDGHAAAHSATEGVGIGNVRARLRCLYGADHAFELQCSAQGTEARVRIPWRRAS